MIKLIATDVDGTLLDDQHQISEMNVQALSACRDRGIDIVLATGKLIHSLMPIVKVLQLNLPHITGSGATIIDHAKKVYEMCSFSPDIYTDIIRFLKKEGCAPVVSIAENTMHYDRFSPVADYIGKTGEKLFSEPDLDCPAFRNKAIAISVLYEREGLDRRLQDSVDPTQAVITKPWKKFLHILPPGVSKGAALQKTINRMGLANHEVAAFGDHINDLSMFEVAGLKIAVENAHQRLAERADFITEKNSQSGVAKAIYEHILRTS